MFVDGPRKSFRLIMHVEGSPEDIAGIANSIERSNPVVAAVLALHIERNLPEPTLRIRTRNRLEVVGSLGFDFAQVVQQAEPRHQVGAKGERSIHYQ